MIVMSISATIIGWTQGNYYCGTRKHKETFYINLYFFIFLFHSVLSEKRSRNWMLPQMVW